MGHTIGYHLVKSGFGLWLPGDERGHWSEAWDEMLGYIEPHTLHPGDPVRNMHLLITYSGMDIDKTAKWLAQEMTKAVHRKTAYTGPVWCEGRWRGFIFDILHWERTIEYIERHNVRRGLPAKPYDFIM